MPLEVLLLCWRLSMRCMLHLSIRLSLDRMALVLCSRTWRLSARICWISSSKSVDSCKKIWHFFSILKAHHSNYFVTWHRFTECIYFQLQHITSGEYEEFISTIRSARTVYHMLPDGNRSFNELIHRLKDQNKSKANKKDLWTHIMAIVTNSCQW